MIPSRPLPGKVELMVYVPIVPCSAELIGNVGNAMYWTICYYICFMYVVDQWKTLKALLGESFGCRVGSGWERIKAAAPAQFPKNAVARFSACSLLLKCTETYSLVNIYIYRQSS